MSAFWFTFIAIAFFGYGAFSAFLLAWEKNIDINNFGEISGKLFAGVTILLSVMIVVKFIL